MIKAMIVPGISHASSQGIGVLACENYIVIAERMEMEINSLNIFIFGKWPWCKQDNAMFTVRQTLLASTLFGHCPLLMSSVL